MGPRRFLIPCKQLHTAHVLLPCILYVCAALRQHCFTFQAPHGMSHFLQMTWPCRHKHRYQQEVVSEEAAQELRDIAVYRPSTWKGPLPRETLSHWCQQNQVSAGCSTRSSCLLLVLPRLLSHIAHFMRCCQPHVTPELAK